jgi:predicted nucleotidyltransferase
MDNMKELPFEIDKLIAICRANDVAMVGLFGSLSRGEGDDNSDVDLMVRFSKRKSLLSLVRIEREISTALGRKVDLLTEAAISPYMKDRIMRELMVLYEQ